MASKLDHRLYLRILLIHSFNSQNAVKSCKIMGKNLSDMSKELEAIAAIGSVGDIPGKLTEAEEAKTEVEAAIMERVSV